MARVRIFRVQIPFSVQVSHNLAKRNKSQGFAVEIRDSRGERGYGEGTPRDYVTGETAEASENASLELADTLVGEHISGLEDLFSFLEDSGGSSIACEYPSAFCAIELALLDLFSRKAGIPLWRLFVKEPRVETLAYSSVLSLLEQSQRTKFLELTKRFGVSQIKAKVSGRGQANELAGEIFGLLGPETDLRLDANGAFEWNEAIEVIEDLRSRNLKVGAFEQPVSKEDLTGLKKVETATSVPVIADESACSVKDVENIISRGWCSGLNIRLSKCGGLLKCIKAAKMARSAGLFCQLGCHVGETSILAAAGRQLAAVCGPFRYTEGSYSKFLLETDVTETPCEFSLKGIATIPRTPGLGIDVSPSLLKSCSEMIAEKG